MHYNKYARFVPSTNLKKNVQMSISIMNIFLLIKNIEICTKIRLNFTNSTKDLSLKYDHLDKYLITHKNQ